VEIRLTSVPFRDVVGNHSALIFIAEDLRPQRRIRELESRLAELESRLAELESRLAGTQTAGDELAAGSRTTGDRAAYGRAGSETAADGRTAYGRAADGWLQHPAGALEGVRVLIVDGNEPWGEELAGILSSLGCLPVRCGAPEQTASVLDRAGTADMPFSVAVVALLGPGGASGLGQRAALRSLGLEAPVIMSSDVDVHGHEQHGIAAVIKRPYRREAVRDALMEALRLRTAG
jgi:hypothetical protein